MGTEFSGVARHECLIVKIFQLTSFRSKLLTLAISAIPTKITAARVLKLAGAFGAFAYHRRHDRAGDLSSARALLFAEGSCRIRMAFQAPVGDHDAFRHGLFG